ncbi:hypothetical protein FOL47_008528 [Perkinsus chesapeaki]|uniref:RNA-editing substrate-binding complex 8 protein HEAT repeats domain-containing protein n=1 Tax=Perkinsus chesapeaki TaxID=330153 RepID=A0A7J6LDJ0_PERCH|nr:hypothetical protein FOL47_008528 [Perkinsus chesapeaki]
MPLTEVSNSTRQQQQPSPASPIGDNRRKSPRGAVFDNSGQASGGNSKRVQMAIQQRIMQAANMYRDPCRTIAEILSVFDEFQRDGVEFNEIHTSTALHRLATAITKGGSSNNSRMMSNNEGHSSTNNNNASVMATYVTSDSRFIRLVERARVLLPRATTRAVSNITWALSKLNYTDEGILDIVTEYMLANLESFDTQGVSNCLYAFGLLRCSSGERRRLLLDRLCEHIPPRLKEFKPQEISNCVYALARLGHRDDNFLAVVAAYIPGCIEHFKAQEMSNVAYSYALLSYRDDPLFQSVADEMVARGMGRCRSQDISNTLYAFAKVNFKCDNLCREVCDNMMIRLHEFNMQGISNTMFALGGLGYRHEAFLNAIADHVVGRLCSLDQFSQYSTPQDFANTLVAFSKLNLRHDPLLDAFGSVMCHRLQSFKSQEIASVVNAYATLGYVHTGFFIEVVQGILSSPALSGLSKPGNNNNNSYSDASPTMSIASRPSGIGAGSSSVPPRLRDFKPGDIALIVYSFGLLMWEPPHGTHFMTAVCNHVASNADKYRPNALTNIALAMGRLQYRDAPCLEAIFSALQYDNTVGQLPNGVTKRNPLTVQLSSVDVCNLLCALGLLSYRANEGILRLLCSRLSDQLLHLTMCKSAAITGCCEHPGHVTNGTLDPNPSPGRDSESPDKMMIAAAQRSSIGSTAPSSGGASPGTISPMYLSSSTTNRISTATSSSSPVTRASIVSSVSSMSSGKGCLSVCGGSAGGAAAMRSLTHHHQQQLIICSPCAIVNVLQALYKLEYRPPAPLILSVCQFFQVPVSRLTDLTSQALVAFLTTLHWSLSEVLAKGSAGQQQHHHRDCQQLSLPSTPSMSADPDSLLAVIRSASFSSVISLAAVEIQTRIHELEVADVISVLKSFSSIMSAEEIDDEISNEGILCGVQDWLTPRIHTFNPEEIAALLEVILETFGPDNAPLATLTPRREKALLPTGLTDTPPTDGVSKRPSQQQQPLIADLRGSVLFEDDESNYNNCIIMSNEAPLPNGCTPRLHLTPGRGGRQQQQQRPMW